MPELAEVQVQRHQGHGVAQALGIAPGELRQGAPELGAVALEDLLLLLLPPVLRQAAAVAVVPGKKHPSKTMTTMAVAGRMGCIAAAEVIGHYGARPEADVRAMFAAQGLL